MANVSPKKLEGVPPPHPNLGMRALTMKVAVPAGAAFVRNVWNGTPVGVTGVTAPTVIF